MERGPAWSWLVEHAFWGYTQLQHTSRDIVPILFTKVPKVPPARGGISIKRAGNDGDTVAGKGERSVLL